MPIFDFNTVSPDPALFSNDPKSYWKRGSVCIFCKSPMIDFAYKRKNLSDYEYNATSLHYCSTCGWPVVAETRFYRDSYGEETRLYIACGSLLNLTLNDLAIPIEEAKKYLCAKYSDRGSIDPRLFEQVVSSVFKNLGYGVTLTNYSGDDGVDVFLDDGNERIGVQVKRYKASISVEQIRSLAGALLLNDVSKGIFVTTSKYQRGVQGTVERYAKRGFLIDLYDADRFFDVLKIATRTEPYNYSEENFDYLIKRVRFYDKELFTSEI